MAVTVKRGRLANVKTRTETGFEQVLHSINILTPYGTKRIKAIKPFWPGEESELNHEYDKVQIMLDLLRKQKNDMDELARIFMEIREVGTTLDRSEKNTLSVVELYQIKTFLLLSEKTYNLIQGWQDQWGKAFPEEFLPADTKELLDILDPGKDRVNTFYIYDQFSAELAELRKEKRELELQVRKGQKDIRRRLEREYKLQMTPKSELLVSKADEAGLKLADGIPELERSEEDYMTVTFTVKADEAIYGLQRRMEQLSREIEDEELLVQEKLSREIGLRADLLRQNCEVFGELDLSLGKAAYARDHDLTRPEIVPQHIIEIEEGRHILVEDILLSKKKAFCPVSVSLKNGVSCITGANMGGKTISLKMIGLTALMAQYGFYVPCGRARLGLSNYMHMLIGDSQNVQRGLSSFGSEMEELKEILDNSKDESLLLIDEIASGTNPVEGLALTQSLIRYLLQKTYISVITTHFDHAATGDQVQNMQVRGLADADFEKLGKELAYANRKERIEIIGRYMDYRLYPVENGKEIPKDALNIAKILGIYDEIIDYARTLLKN